MPFYLSTENISAAIHKLNNPRNSIQNNLVFHFLLLKACKINNLEYQPLTNITTFAKDLGFNLCSLFNPFEQIPSKVNFLNPFEFFRWDQKPSEGWNQWISTRFKNNIIGGSVLWREVLVYDANENKIKFTYEYLNFFEKQCNITESKIDLLSIAIWYSRFLSFEKKITAAQLISNFLNDFNITNEERATFFTTTHSIPLSFNEEIHDTAKIRNLLTNKPSQISWIKPNLVQISDPTKLNHFKGVIMTNNSLISVDELNYILDLYGQVILSGPPGTSKSYLSSQLIDSGEFGIIKKIQFHPQFSYQQFIGGYIVDGTNVTYQDGILLKLIEDIKKFEEQYPPKKHLLIIDEINRANLSQVFGETIQCLDRGNSVQVLIDQELQNVQLPENLYIIGTMNSSDRTIGSVDHALRRRFINVYCPPTPDILTDLCETEANISLTDLLNKINNSLIENTNNRELVIGHALFLNPKLKNTQQKFVWNNKNLEILFNHKILPIIEEYAFGDNEQIKNILGEQLPQRLSNEEFIDALSSFILGNSHE